ncbi:hypothetical protein BO82DRAFT_409838 [Aspergillus uvarum CBS 121591]|uniref:Rhodopsin domain-containing protein n=1 Tax=Aspergillus uvarum CBS 121591 TaxID=1448315 RepID=A0A319BTQ3_9EURO|nr:hypothetical protein BO82DRAFT_409838 [Aspergillus uvarum CBS 121591]PYH75617.1 hypothetical protein BO82DRAFT_409838 [Aspergillus uvarum CBS 121591]
MPKGHLFVPIQSVLILGMIFSLTCLILRLRVRRRLNGRLYPEDVCLVLSWIVCINTQGLILYALYNAGLGVHVQDLTTRLLDLYEKLFLATACLFVTGLCLARGAHLIFLGRILAGKHTLRYALYAATAFITAGSFIIISLFVFACRPITRSWNVSQAGKCISRPAIFIAVAVLNICSDILLALLPVPLIYNMQVPRAQKVKFVILSIMVCVTFVASAIRLRVTIPLLKTDDLTYDIAPLALLVGIEANLIVIAACLPALRQGFRMALKDHDMPRDELSKPTDNLANCDSPPGRTPRLELSPLDSIVIGPPRLPLQISGAKVSA